MVADMQEEDPNVTFYTVACCMISHKFQGTWYWHGYICANKCMSAQSTV